ncbi:hypothetical protein GTW69_02150, partial [Streptomyces sp. SID7760]|nr:hypothetical protein [Streptomyces sp. SID7760]
ARPAAGGAPAPDEAHDGAPTALPAGGGKPQTPGEHLLVALWREVLEVSEVGVHDEFYASGGNSMRAVRIVTAAREQGLELPLDRMLGQHTIREVIAHTEAAAAAPGHRTTAAPAAA